jgi:hypothetical protein
MGINNDYTDFEWEFEAHEQEDGSFLVRVPSQQVTIARVWEWKPGAWSTDLYAENFFKQSDAPTKFDDKGSWQEACKAIADWGHNNIAVFLGVTGDGDSHRERHVFSKNGAVDISTLG